MVSGPATKTINNSGLGAIKRVLCGLPPFLGGQRYLLFGTELHYRCLERKKGKWKPYHPDEALSMEHGIKALFKNKEFLKYYPGAIIEKTLTNNLCFGIHGMHGTLDINNRKFKTTVDLKTTSCETEQEFFDKAIKLGYPRQGVVYEELSGNTQTIFIGISKKNIEPDPKAKPIYPIFVLNLNDHAKEKEYARNEAEFLLSFYKNYGFPNDKYLEQNRKNFEPSDGSKQDSE